MIRPSFVSILVFTMGLAIASELHAQVPTPDSKAREQFNQVFVKVIVPIPPHTPKQEGLAAESWIAEQLKQLGESEYFAATDWVPVCDELLADEIVDNRVQLRGKLPFARSAETSVKEQTVVCWLASMALHQAVAPRTSGCRMNRVVEQLAPCV